MLQRAPPHNLLAGGARTTMAQMRFSTLDLTIVLAYMGLVVGVGAWFAWRGRGTDEYMAAGRSLPGWALGLSIFGSYISSISFLANPGKAFEGNWSALVFSLSIPLAAWMAVKYFVPFYRASGAVSAYEHLEGRFGAWARTYAVVCFLLVQVARMGTIVYLLGLTITPLTGYPTPWVIVVTGCLMTFYTFLGGIEAVVWAGVVQSALLAAAVAACLICVVGQTPGGLGEIVHIGLAADKFSLGTFDPALDRPTFLVVFLYGVTTHLQNFGVDQSYVQRYVTARTDRDARRSVWIGAWLYLPVATVFFLLGTALFAFYSNANTAATLPPGIKGDEVLPYFIATQLPVGIKGLVIAGILAAAMDSNLNNMATLTLCDIYKRYFRPRCGERESMRVLRTGTLAWGSLGTGVALAMLRVHSALDTWWKLAGILSGGVLGLFLLGLFFPRASPWGAAVGVIAGVAMILWLTFSKLNPFDDLMTLSLGTLAILVVGLALGGKRVPAA